MADLVTLIAAFHLANERAKQAEQAKQALTTPPIPNAVLALIADFYLKSDTPFQDFLDSWKPGDLDDLAATLGITPEQAEQARAMMNERKTA